MSTGYRKRPIPVDAIQWTGDNEDEVVAFTGRTIFYVSDPEDRALADDPDHTAAVLDSTHSTWVGVYTGDWIIRGVENEYYPCADSIFTASYMPAADFQAAVAEAIRGFDFANYGMDEVAMIVDEEWAEHLAARITHHLASTP